MAAATRPTTLAPEYRITYLGQQSPVYHPSGDYSELPQHRICETAAQLAEFNNQIMPSRIDSIFELCDLMVWFYEHGIQPSYATAAKIDAHIKTLRAADQWRDLTTPMDYALSEFRRRMLPYFSVDSKEWRASCMVAGRSDYPAELSMDDRSGKKKTHRSRSESPARKRKHNVNKKKTKTNNVNVQENDTEQVDAEQVNVEPKPHIDLIMEPQDWNPESAVDRIVIHTRNNNFLAMEIEPTQTYATTQKIAICVEQLFIVRLTSHALRLFAMASLNPKHCDVFRYANVVELVSEALGTRHSSLLAYLMYYAQYLIRHEETIMFSQVNPRYRVLFTLEEAGKFPIFKSVALKSNPYIQQLSDCTDLRYSAPFFLQGERRINDVNTFARRFQIATGGIFDGLDLAALGATITGSILIPCVHQSPLEVLYRGVRRDYRRAREFAAMNLAPHMTVELRDSADYDFFNYLEEFYPSYVSLTDEDFQATVLDVERADYDEHTDDEHDCGAVVPEYDMAGDQLQTEDADVDSEPLWCRATEIKKGVNFNQLADIDCGISCESHDRFKDCALTIYHHVRQRAMQRGPVYITEIKTISSIKYKIHGPGMCRPMDIFRVPYGPEKMVKKFHVQFVRMFYDGQVRMFRSCVTSLLSGLSDTYKWFSCNKIPIDVILKYAQRGLTTMLNKKERSASSVFLDNDKRWGEAIKAMCMTPGSIWQCVTQTHPFFLPSMYNCGIRMGLRAFDPALTDVIAVYPDLQEQATGFVVKQNTNVLAPDYTKIEAAIGEISEQ